MAIHVAYVTPTPVLNGMPIDKDTATIKEMLSADTEMRVVPDDTIPNSLTKPDIKTYLQNENTAGFKVKSVTNTMIVTEM